MKHTIVIVLLAFCGMSFANPVITDVTAQQRYPWNGKVDIVYTVSGVEEAAKTNGWMTSLKVIAIDQATMATNVAEMLTGDFSFADGTHKIVWDMNADGLTYESTNILFQVACETTPALYCVVNLFAGSSANSYPVSYMNEIPGGSWSDEYKTTKLILTRINAGSFLMQGSTITTLTKAF